MTRRLTLFTLLLSALLASAARAAELDLSSPKKALLTFFAAGERGDAAAMKACLTKAAAAQPNADVMLGHMARINSAARTLEDAAVAAFGPDAWFVGGGAPVSALTREPEIVESIKGDVATVGAKHEKAPLRCRREGGVWKVDFTEDLKEAAKTPRPAWYPDAAVQILTTAAAHVRAGKFVRAEAADDYARQALGQLYEAAAERPDAPYQPRLPDPAPNKPSPAPAAKEPPELPGPREPAARSVVFLCNASAPMGASLDDVKAELTKAVSHLKPPMQFNVVFWQNGRPVPLAKTALLEATDANKQRLAEFLKKVHPVGDDNPLGAIAFSMRLKPQLLYFLSGPSIPDAAAVRKAFADENPDRRTKVNAVAFTGRSKDEPAAGFLDGMQAIAQENNGVFKRVASEDVRE